MFAGQQSLPPESKKEVFSYSVITDLDCTASALVPLEQGFSQAYPHALSPELVEFMRRDIAEDKGCTWGDVLELLPELSSSALRYEDFAICTARHLDDFYSFGDFYIPDLVQKNKGLAKHYKKLIAGAQEKADKIFFESKLSQIMDCSEIDPDDVFIIRIKRNLEEETGLKCVTVSTPEDRDNECGSGFEKIIEPHELDIIQRKWKLIKSEWIHPSTSPVEWKKICYPKPKRDFRRKPIQHIPSNKNHQIISTINKMLSSKKKRSTFFVFDFVDDVPEILENAKKIPQDKLPENVVLRLYRADAYKRAPIEWVGTIRGPIPLNKQQAIVTIKAISEDPHIVMTTNQSKALDDILKRHPSIECHVVDCFLQQDDLYENSTFWKNLKKKRAPNLNDIFEHIRGLNQSGSLLWTPFYYSGKRTRSKLQEMLVFYSDPDDFHTEINRQKLFFVMIKKIRNIDFEKIAEHDATCTDTYTPTVKDAERRFCVKPGGFSFLIKLRTDDPTKFKELCKADRNTTETRMSSLRK